MSGKKAPFTIRPFDKLNKKLEAKCAVAPAPIRRKKKDEFTEEELFCHAMDEVQEIEEFRSLSCAQHPKKGAPPAGRPDPDCEALSVLSELAGGQRPMHLPDTQEYVEWAHPECAPDTIPMLHAGHYSVQGFIDLHGCSVPEAEEELEGFIQESFKKGLRCVKIIHGRGLRSVKGARIKEAVVKRLSGRFRKDILAYVTARQCDGGLGALYVLLGKK